MKNKSIGMIAGIFGMLSAQTGMRKVNSNVNPSTSRNRPSRTTWRTSSPSEYFGQRSKPVTAKFPNGTIKQMKLKNALKKNAEIIW